MAEQDPTKSDSKFLADLMRVGAGDRRLWDSSELGAILRHQLTAPVQFDLERLDAGLAAKLRTLSEARGLLLRSFDDLLHHPNPPVELLELTKQFAKACSADPDSPLPRDIARVLYLASIVAALLRCRQRITDLDDESLRRGLEWAVRQGWMQNGMRALMEEGLRHLASPTGTAP